LKANLAQGDPRPPERSETSAELVDWLWKTVAEPLTNNLFVGPGVTVNQ